MSFQRRHDDELITTNEYLETSEPFEWLRKKTGFDLINNNLGNVHLHITFT